jgi:hypothetical protein
MKEQTSASDYTLGTILLFFIPLALSASLTSVSHVIINGTLSRAESAEVIISNYAIAFSLFSIMERPALVFRQTSSALAKGKGNFQSLCSFFIKIMVALMLVCILIAFSPLGDWMFIHLFNADPESLPALLNTFKVLAVVILLSGIRTLYQGIMINHLETKWVTYGVIIRLVGMITIALYFIRYADLLSSMAGAIIFLTGMLIECVISVWRGHRLMNREKADEDLQPLTQKAIGKFYTPLAFYVSFQTLVTPIIYACLSYIDNVSLGIASFALAFSVTNLIISFFMYTHQVVLQFYETNKRAVFQCIVIFSIVPSTLLLVLCYTPAGIWFMDTVFGTTGTLAKETLYVLQFFIVKTFVFPWVDYLGGILMLNKKTGAMLKPQIYNLVTVVIVLVTLVVQYPALNGRAGAIAASIGELVGLMAVYFVVKKYNATTAQQTNHIESM